MTDSTLTIIVAFIGSGALSAIVGGVMNIISKNSESKNGINSGIRLILKDRIRFLAMHYIQQGWIYEDELEDLMAMHEVYHNKLGGNGFLDEQMRKVKALEVRGIGVH